MIQHRRHRTGLPVLLLLPALVLELLVHVVPVLIGVAVSTRQLTGRFLSDWTGAPFIGIDNYRAVLDVHDPLGRDLLISAARTAAYTILVVGVSWCLGLFAAVLLAAPFRGRAWFRVLFLFPFALPAYVSVLAWQFAFDRDAGLLNHLLVDDLHLFADRPFWLIGGNAFWATVVVAIWRLWPFAFLVLDAALRAVPREVHEAAAMDGAGAWQQCRRIMLPATRQASILVAAVAALWTATDFTTPYLLFGVDPPPAATFLPGLAYQTGFVGFHLGIASAMNVVIAVALLLLALPAARRLLGRVRADA